MVWLPVQLLDMQETHVDMKRHIKDPGSKLFSTSSLFKPSQEVFQLFQKMSFRIKEWRFLLALCLFTPLLHRSSDFASRCWK